MHPHRHAPYFSDVVRDQLKARQVIHFADNKAANSAAVKGGSSAPDIARVVSAMHVRWCQDGINVWIEYVQSDSNLADLPSRGDFSWVQELQATRVAFTLPPYHSWE